MKKIRVIQIGIGHDHAMDVLDSMVAMSDVFEVVALGLPESEFADFKDKIKICKEKMGITAVSVCEALKAENIDAAVIETEEENLCKFALLAAENGLHIHMDKPGCADALEFEQLIRALKEKNLVFSTGYMYRFNPEIMKVFEAVENGEFGEIYSIEAQMNCEQSLDKRKWLKKLPGGMMFFLGCHLIDIVLRIQGRPQEILPLNKSTQKSVCGEDLGMAVLKYENGCSIVKVSGVEAGGFARRQLVISGAKKTTELRPIEKWLTDNIFSFNGCVDRLNMSTSVRTVNSCGGWNADGGFVESIPFNRYDGMMRRFAQRVNFDDEKIYTKDYELKLYRLILKACGEE